MSENPNGDHGDGHPGDGHPGERGNDHEHGSPVLLTPNEKTVLKGYEQCREECREGLGNFKWAMGNLSTEQRYGIWALMSYVSRCWNLMSLDQPEKRQSVLEQWRRENMEWFQGNFYSGRLVALSDTTARFKIPNAYLIQMLTAVEHWLEEREFPTAAKMDAFADKLGGAAMSCLLAIMGQDEHHHDGHRDDHSASNDHHGHEGQSHANNHSEHQVSGADGVEGTAARPDRGLSRLEEAVRQIGKALVKTHLLTRFASNLKRGRVFLPQEELAKRHCRVAELTQGKADSGFCNLVSKVAGQCRSELLDASRQLDGLSFDGQRVLKSVLSIALRLLDKVEQEPAAILKRPIELTAGEQFKFQLKHVLGIEGGPELKHMQAVAH